MRELLFKELIMEELQAQLEAPHVSIWNKTAEEVTVKDQLIISGVALTVLCAAPLAIGYGIYGATNLYEKCKAKREAKKARKLEVVEPKVVS
jgi:hypothetical protein